MDLCDEVVQQYIRLNTPTISSVFNVHNSTVYRLY